MKRKDEKMQKARSSKQQDMSCAERIRNKA